MARNGKIARMPAGIRGKLNERLRDAEEADTVLEWLNGLPEVQGLLKEKFNGVAVSPQNLSEWRQGGYQEWLLHQEAREMATEVTQQAAELENSAKDNVISDQFATVLTMELIRTGQARLAGITDVEERWEKVQELTQLLNSLRREDHRAMRLRMDHARWEWEDDEKEREEDKRETQEMLAPFFAGGQRDLMAQYFGGGVAGTHMANCITAVRLKKPLEEVEEMYGTEAVMGKREDETREDGKSPARAAEGSERRVKEQRRKGTKRSVDEGEDSDTLKGGHRTGAEVVDGGKLMVDGLKAAGENHSRSRAERTADGQTGTGAQEPERERWTFQVRPESEGGAQLIKVNQTQSNQNFEKGGTDGT